MAHKGRFYPYLFQRDLSCDQPTGWTGWLPKIIAITVGSGTLDWPLWSYPDDATPVEGVGDMSTGVATWEWPPVATHAGLCWLTWKIELTFDITWWKFSTQLFRDVDASIVYTFNAPPLLNSDFFGGGVFGEFLWPDAPEAELGFHLEAHTWLP